MKLRFLDRVEIPQAFISPPKVHTPLKLIKPELRAVSILLLCFLFLE